MSRRPTTVAISDCIRCRLHSRRFPCDRCADGDLDLVLVAQPYLLRCAVHNWPLGLYGLAFGLISCVALQWLLEALGS